MTNRLLINRERRRTEAMIAFAINMTLAILIFAPFILLGEGVLTLFSDFNKQQLTFNINANNAIKAGRVYWSWSADLGTNFIGAFSFYNLGSPFFWLSLLFPASAFPYLIGPMLILKHAVAGLTSQLYFRRFLKMPTAALLASILYTWSGFQFTNLQFNHFHDVTAFFPLFLLAMEVLVKDGKKGRFALMTALMAMINYFFFIGQVVFAVIYFLFRFISKSNRREGTGFWGSLLAVLGEGVLGIGMAAVLFLPSTLFVVGSPRAEHNIFQLAGIFHSPDRYLMLIRSALFPVDPMGMNSVIYSAEFSSIGFYLPVFAMTAIHVYLRRGRGMLRSLFITLALMALLPHANSLFFAFHGQYYARWLFMPSLIAALITAVVLERGVYVDEADDLEASDPQADRRWIRFTRGDMIPPAVVSVIFILFIFIWPRKGYLEVMHRLGYWIFNMVLAVIGYAISVYLLTRTRGLSKRSQKSYRLRSRVISLSVVAVSAFVLLIGWVSVERMQRNDVFDQPPSIRDRLIKAGLELNEVMPRDDFYRIYNERLNWNIAFVADLAPVNAFTSTISPAIFDFYDSLGYRRYVYTYMPRHYEQLLSFLAVRYLIEEVARDDLTLFHRFDSDAGPVFVYELDEGSQIPFGFTIDRYIDMKDFMDREKELRQRFLVEGVVMDETSLTQLLDAYPDALNVRKTSVDPKLARLSFDDLANLQDQDPAIGVAARQEDAPLTFEHTNKGFHLTYDLEEARFAYFTAPYDVGWTAIVNGKKSQIVEANGFMLLALPAGKSEVTFNYQPPGATAGIVISIVALAIWLYLYRPKSLRILPSGLDDSKPATR